jgi:hypothetical protein
MNVIEKLARRKSEIVREIAALGPMRKGSLCQQFVEATRRDGSKVRRGPYTIYSFKEKNKTRSRRIGDPKRAAVYREQINAFRRFRQLSAGLVEVSQRLADQIAEKQGAEKKTSPA